MKKKVIFIVGPTAIGKTALSIEIAKALKTEIISCDSRQFYKELVIGTAPPNNKELSQVKHHFIHSLSITKEYNAGIFEKDAIKLINQIHKKKDVIIIVGGSGLYVDAICKGFDKIPEVPHNIRSNINKLFKEKGLIWLQEKVQSVDPEFYKNCDTNNSQRLIRALEIFKSHNKSLSSFKTESYKERPFEIIKIGLNTNRELLYKKINTRVDNMIEKGLVDEVSSLLKYQHLNALQTVGYKEIFAFINHETTLEEAIKNIKQNTRRFAKRQLTWFRKDVTIKWFEPHQFSEIKKIIGL